MNKKGQIFVIFVTIAVAMTLFTLYNGYEAKYGVEEGKEAQMGISAYAVLNAYQEQEAALTYVDTVSELSFNKALNEVARKGGLANAECGANIYNLLNNENKNCLPKKYEENIENTFKKHFEKRLTYNKLDLITDYDLELTQKKEYSELIGKSKEKVKATITIGGGLKEYSESEEKDTSSEIKDRLKLYEELIQKEAVEHKLRPALIKAIIVQESKGEKHAISETGCAGIMQFCYSTARDYFENEEQIKSIDTVCEKKQISNLINYQCTSDTLNTDPRFNPDLAIPAAAEYLDELIHETFKDKEYGIIFAIASYNGGQGLIKSAIRKSDKNNPKWNEVAFQINEQLIKDKYKGNYWNDKDNREAKVKEIKNYVENVNGYFQTLGGQNLLAKKTLGWIKFEPNFHVIRKYNTTIYEELKKFAKQTIDECKDNVGNCLNEKIASFNQEHKEQIKTMEECEELSQKVFYKFLENTDTCTYNPWHPEGKDCKCQLNEPIGSLGTYSVNFLPEENIAVLTKPVYKWANFSASNKFLFKPKNYVFTYSEAYTGNAYISKKTNNDDLRIEFGGEPLTKIYVNKRGNTHSISGKQATSWWEQTEILWGLIKKGTGSFEDIEILDKRYKKNLPENCIVPKSVFRLCLDTNYELPIFKEKEEKNDEIREKSVKGYGYVQSFDTSLYSWAENQVDTLIANINKALDLFLTATGSLINALAGREIFDTYEEDVEIEYTGSKIKFGLTLIDEVAPPKVENLDVNIDRNLEITLTWNYNKETSDLVVYEVYFSEQEFNQPLEHLKTKVVYSEDALALDKENPNWMDLINSWISDEEFYYETLTPTNNIKYTLTIPSSNLNPPIEPGKEYRFAIVGVDKFQNRITDVSTSSIIIPSTP